MELHEVRQKIIKILYRKEYTPLDEILKEFDPSDHGKVVHALGDHLKRLVIFDEKKGYKFIHMFMNKPKPVHPSKPRFSQITCHPMPACLVGAAPVLPDVIPADTTDLVPLDQNIVGDCVGCSGSTMNMITRFRVLGIKISAEVIAKIQRNVKTIDGVIVDLLPDEWVSPAAIYNMARGRMNPPPLPVDEGAAVTDAADVVIQQGVVPEWMWPTGKTTTPKYDNPPMQTAALIAQNLPLNALGGAYAVLDGVNGDPTTQLKQTLLSYGGCWMTIPVFDNYGMAMPSGDFPDPIEGVSKIIGWHAVVAKGCIRDVAGKLRWQFVNSWFGTTPLINTLSDEGYMQPHFKNGNIQLFAMMGNHVVPFVAKPNPVPIPIVGPEPEPQPQPQPEPQPQPMPLPDFLTLLIDAIVAFFRSIFGRFFGGKKLQMVEGKEVGTIIIVLKVNPEQFARWMAFYQEESKKSS